jgi:hypothetical protein
VALSEEDTAARVCDHSAPTTAEGKNAWIHISTPHTLPWCGKLNFTFSLGAKTTLNFAPPENKILIAINGKLDTIQNKNNKETPWLLVRKQIIPTDQPPLVSEF